MATTAVDKPDWKLRRWLKQRRDLQKPISNGLANHSPDKIHLSGNRTKLLRCCISIRHPPAGQSMDQDPIDEESVAALRKMPTHIWNALQLP